MPARLVTWNANGLKPRISELRAFIQQQDLDLVLLNETKLTDKDKIKINNYQILRKDRTNRGGGVAIIIKNNIAYQTIKLDNRLSIEAICIKLENKTHIIAVYNRPSNNFTNLDLDILTSVGDRVLIIGDLNAKHTSWNNTRNNTNGLTLYNYSKSNNLVILCTQDPTHYPENNTTPTHIDIIINKNTNNITNPVSIPGLTSDHNPVHFKLNHIKKENIRKSITSYKNTDWGKFKQDINDSIIINNNLDTPNKINEEVQKFTMSINKAKEKHTKNITINSQKEQLTDDIKTLIKKRNALRKQHQRTRLPTLKTSINSLNRHIKDEIRTLLNTKWQNKLENLSSTDNTIWKMTQILKKPKKPIPTLSLNNDNYYTDKDKANIIGDILQTIQSNTAQSPIQNQVDSSIKSFHYNPSSLDIKTKQKLLTNPKEIKNLIKSLPNNKSPGPDGIDYKIIKNLTQKAIVQIMYIINAILITGYFPDQWKKAIIIPIPKPNKDITNPINYRPISLLSTLSKLTEKIILSRIQAFENHNEIIIDEQFGFRAGHSTTMQAARIAFSIKEQFSKHKTTSMCLLDIEKAFDTVWQDGLIHKLINHKFPEHLIQLVINYLKNREFVVKINNSLSEPKRSRAGVPQGSVLGPVLFNYFINDIPKFPKTQVAIYADDTAILAHSFSAQVATYQIQIHLNLILKFLQQWKIHLNKHKTEHIIFARKFNDTKLTTPLQIEGTKITPKHCVKYLGISMDKKLYFKTHIKNITDKVNNSIRTLYPLLNKKSPMSIKNKKLLYTVIIRPIISYAAPVWTHNASTTTLNTIQRLQNRCLRLVLNKDRYTRIHTLHQLADMPSIKEHITKLTKRFVDRSLCKSQVTKHLTNKFNTQTT